MRVPIHTTPRARAISGSIGALNVAYFAGSPTPREVSLLDSLWRGLRRADISPLSWRRRLGFLRGGPGFLRRALLEFESG
jgi:NTE family protein